MIFLRNLPQKATPLGQERRGYQLSIKPILAIHAQMLGLGGIFFFRLKSVFIHLHSSWEITIFAKTEQ